MRITLVVENFNIIGGIQEAVQKLAENFVRLGHDVTVLSTRVVSLDEYERVPQEGYLLSYFNLRAYRAPLSWCSALPINVVRLLGKLRASRPDVVSSHVWNPSLLPPLVGACCLTGVPMVHTLHIGNGNASRARKWMLRSLRMASALIAVSTATRRDYQMDLPGAENANIIPNGVDINDGFAPAASRGERPYIFCAARLSLDTKAIDTLILSFKIIASEYPAVDLWIAGAGNDGEAIGNLIANCAMEDRVRLLGGLRAEHLRRLYREALFFAMPSRGHEALGMVFLEAMAAGRAVVGTAVGGIPEIISHGDNGLLVEQDDAVGLASALRALLANPDARYRMGQRGRRRIMENHNWRKICARYLDVFASVQ